MVHMHQLNGCAPAPLAHYLKALGILRLVAEQADESVRGWWEGDRFRLASCLTLGQLEDFFLRRYSPTPMLTPWNGASGLYKTWDQRKNALRKSKNFDAMNGIRESIEERWLPYRNALIRVDSLLASLAYERSVADLSDSERKKILIIPRDDVDRFPTLHRDSDKMDIQKAMQRTLHTVAFFRSVIVDVGKDKPEYPSLWGSGGNDGAMDFTARYVENLQIALDANNTQTKELLGSCLSAEPVSGLLNGQAGKVGQFLPGGAGGVNSVNGVGSQNDTLLNPWDFILMLEGAVNFTSHMSRQCGLEPSRAASPFVVNASGAAYASASQSDETPRGEQWMPLWSRPLCYAELRRLLAEGRAQVGAKAAREPLDIARAVKRMGTARGIHAFQRYGYIERNGQSNLAVPLGRFESSDGNAESLACIDDLDAWLRRLQRQARGRGAPARLAKAEKCLVDALLAITEQPAIPSVWQRALICLADIEGIVRTGSGSLARPVPRLRPEWAAASDDGTAEFRLAIAFALQARGFHSSKSNGSIRRHWLPLDRRSPQRFATTAGRLEASPEVVMHGRRGVDDAIALVQRRLVEASQGGVRHMPLSAVPNAASEDADLASLLAGGVSLDRTLALGRAFMALDHESWTKRRIHVERPRRPSDSPDDAWLAIRLCLLPWPLDARGGFKLDIGADPAIVRRLAGGDAQTAVAIALRRLRAAGVRCTVRAASASARTARLWAAALAFPITKGTALRFLYQLDPNKE